MSELKAASCHCGAVTLNLASTPDEVFECNCSICRRLGVLWAYYHCDNVEITQSQPTNVYVWNRKMLEFHSCPACGCTTHWIAVDKSFKERMGVNARLIDGLGRHNTTLGHVDHGDIGRYWTRD